MRKTRQGKARYQDPGNLGSQQKYIYLFTVGVFNSHVPSNCQLAAAACYRRRIRERRVIDAEHGSFIPLQLVPPCVVAGVLLSELLSRDWPALSQARFTTIQKDIWLNPLQSCLTLIGPVVMCLRGARSSFHNPSRDLSLHDLSLVLIVNETQ